MENLIDLDKLFSAGAHVTVVPTPQMLIKRNEKHDCITEEEMSKYIQDNTPLEETIKVFRDIVKKSYPDANCIFFAAKKGTKRTELSYEHTGKDDDSLCAAITETINNDNHAFYVFRLVTYMFTKQALPSRAETAITGLQDLIKELSKLNDVFQQVQLKNAEIKRLKKANRMDLVSIKEKEIQELFRIHERNINTKKKRLENLEKARAALAKKRMKDKMKQDFKQPNFAKMAKKQRQKIAARQAEKKKKRSSSSESECIFSCSQLLKSK